jgi:hypothetical protein
MRAAAIARVALVSVLLLAGPAHAQGKDPFQPPASSAVSGASGGGNGSPAGSGSSVTPEQPATSGRLPRTGLDYSLPVLAAGVLIALGASMRLTSRALAQ